MVVIKFERNPNAASSRSLMSQNDKCDDCSFGETVQTSSSSLTDSILSTASSPSVRPQWRKRSFNPIRRWSVENSMNYIISKGNQLLEYLRPILIKEKQRIKELSIAIQAHIEMGKARYSINNVRGAIMSMKHVEKLRVEQRKAMSVIEYLQHREIDLLTKVEEVQDAKASLEKIGYRPTAEMSERFSLVAFQLSISNKIDDRIQTIREERSESKVIVDETLLLNELKTALS